MRKIIEKESVSKLWNLHGNMGRSSPDPNQADKSKGAGSATTVVGGGTKDLPGTTKASRPTASFLDKLPPEVRVMIYEELLTRQEGVFIRDECLSPYTPVHKWECEVYATGLHPTISILRTCRTIYHEGLLILYGRNQFCFTDPYDLNAFAYSGLKENPAGDVQFGLQYEPHGRLAFVRNVCLSLEDVGELNTPWRKVICNDKDRVMKIRFPKLQRLLLNTIHSRVTANINVCFAQTTSVPLLP